MKINQQKYFVRSVSDLTPHPSNPRQGDVGSIHESIDVNGFYGALIVQKSTGHVLAGNHRLKAAVASGAETVPVIEVDCDDETATRILIADNRTNDVASYDNDALANLLKELASTSGLAGTGFDGDDLDQLLGDIDADISALTGNGLGEMVIAYSLVFDTDEQQKRWFAFLRWLRHYYPDAETNAVRLDMFLEGAMSDNA